MSKLQHCDSSKKDTKNCGMLCWFQDNQENCGMSMGKQVSFQNNNLCCTKNFPFPTATTKSTILDGYNCTLKNDKLQLGNEFDWPNMKVLFVSKAGQNDNKMFTKFLNITNNGNNSDICNSIQ